MNHLSHHRTWNSRIAAASLIALASWLSAGPVSSASVPFGTNGGSVDFVDVMKQSIWNDTSSLDANGWPQNDNSVNLIDARHNMPWNGPDPTAINADISGTYHLSFNGQATLSAFTEAGSGADIANQVYNAGSNTTTADLVVAAGRYLLGLSLTETKRNASAATDSGFTNLRVLRPGYSVSSPPLVTRETVRAYAPPFTSIRFLETDAA